MEYYNRFADDFEKVPFEEILPSFFLKHTSSLPICPVLDVGSGPGAWGKWLSDRGYDVTCLDPSEQMVKRCKAKGLKTIQGTQEEVEFTDTFPIIFALSSLIHVPKKYIENSIRTIAELLDSEGIFIISMLVGEGEKIEDPLNRGSKRYFNYFKEEELKSIFQSMNFSILDNVTVENEKMNKTFVLYALTIKPIFERRSVYLFQK